MARLLVTARNVSQYGAARMAAHYTTALVAAGHEVTLAYQTQPDGGRTGSTLDDLQQGGVRAVHVPGIQWAVFPRGCRPLDAMAREHDLVMNVHVRDLAAAGAVATRAGKPSISWLQNTPNFQGPLPVRLLKSRLYRQAICMDWAQL